jgi:hypothetical protein
VKGRRGDRPVDASCTRRSPKRRHRGAGAGLEPRRNGSRPSNPRLSASRSGPGRFALPRPPVGSPGPSAVKAGSVRRRLGRGPGSGGPGRTGPGPSVCQGATPTGPAEPNPPQPSLPAVGRVMSAGFCPCAAGTQPGGSDRPAGGGVGQLSMSFYPLLASRKKLGSLVNSAMSR